jgi:DHA2 family multidrug resistance protein
MCGGIGTSVTSTIWENRTTLHHAQLAEHTGIQNPAFDQSVHALMAQGMSEPGAWAVIERTIGIQASTSAATDIFWISSVLFLSLIALVWMTKPSKSAMPVDAGGAH